MKRILFLLIVVMFGSNIEAVGQQFPRASGPSPPFDLFFEIEATLFVVQPVGLELDLLIGTRFYF